MAIKIKKATQWALLGGIIALGFIGSFFLEFLLGGSANLAKLESKTKKVLSNRADLIVPVVNADTVACACGDGCGCGGDASAGDGDASGATAGGCGDGGCSGDGGCGSSSAA